MMAQDLPQIEEGRGGVQPRAGRQEDTAASGLSCKCQNKGWVYAV